MRPSLFLLPVLLVTIPVFAKDLPDAGPSTHDFVTAQPAAVEDSNISLLAHWADGPSVAVATDGHLTWLARGGYLEILDCTDPQSPTLVSQFRLPGFISEIRISGDLAFVHTEDRGIHILDVTDVHDISLRSFIAFEGNLVGLQVIGDRLYYGELPRTFQIVDISDPDAPVLLGSHTQSNLGCCSVVGDHAYMGDPTGTLYIINLTDPSAPYLENTVPPVAGAPYHTTLIAENGQLHGILRNFFGFKGWIIYDLANPVVPSTLSYLTGDFGFRELAVDDGRACFSNFSELHIYDIDTPSAPSLLGTAPLLETPASIAISGEHVYLAEASLGMQCFDMAATPERSDPVEVSRYTEGLHAACTDVILRGSTGFVATDHGLVIVDATEPAQSKILGTLYKHDSAAPDTRVFHLFIDGDFLYMRCSEDGVYSLRIIDISNLSDPVEVASLPGSLFSMQFRDGIGYCSRIDGGPRLLAYDFTDPAAPVLLQELSLVSSGMLALQGDRLLVATGDDLTVYDITDPAMAVELGSTDLGWDGTPAQLRIVVVAGTAYIAGSLTNNNATDMRVVQYSDPSAMIVHAVADEPIDRPWDMATDGEYLYLALGSSGVQMYSLDDPLNPASAGTYRTGYWAWGISGDAESILVADSHDGVFVLRNDDALSGIGEPLPSASLSLDCYPNPFNPLTTIRYRLPASTHTRLVIYDVSGRRIRQIHAGQQVAGWHTLEWNGRDDLGGEVASGMYLLHLEAGSCGYSRKIALVR